MVTATTLNPSSMVHGPVTPVAGKKNPAQTDPKSEFTATPVEKKMIAEKMASQTSGAETHRSTKFDGTEVLVTLQEDGVENTTPITPEHSKKLKIAVAHAMTSSSQETIKSMTPFDAKA